MRSGALAARALKRMGRARAGSGREKPASRRTFARAAEHGEPVFGRVGRDLPLQASPEKAKKVSRVDLERFSKKQAERLMELYIQRNRSSTRHAHARTCVFVSSRRGPVAVLRRQLPTETQGCGC